MAAASQRAMGRRLFLRQAGRGVLGVAVLTLAGCGDRDEGQDRSRPRRSRTAAEPQQSVTPADDETAAATGLSWAQVDLGFVSAYVLVRGREGAVVDTGVAGSADEIGSVLVAGDALNNDGGLSGSNPQFTEDSAAAADSVRRLAQLEPRVILVGHGPPVRRAAAADLRQLASSLP